VWDAFGLAGFGLIQDFSAADVILLNGVIPDPEKIAAPTFPVLCTR
jgi:hypothetical protein